MMRNLNKKSRKSEVPSVNTQQPRISQLKIFVISFLINQKGEEEVRKKVDWVQDDLLKSENIYWKSSKKLFDII